MTKLHKPIRKVSKRRAGQRRQYIKLADKFLSLRPNCQCCGTWLPFEQRQVHHKFGRAGSLYLDQQTWMCVCQFCHTQIHQAPKAAQAKGWLGHAGQWNNPRAL